MKVLLILLFCSSISFARNTTQKDSSFIKSIEEGVFIYDDFCVTCHLPNGKGVEGLIPPLANSDYLLNDINASIKAIKYGLKGEIVVNGISYNNSMATSGLTDEEIADVMNYITNTWGNKHNVMITVEEVSKIQP